MSIRAGRKKRWKTDDDAVENKTAATTIIITQDEQWKDRGKNIMCWERVGFFLLLLSLSLLLWLLLLLLKLWQWILRALQIFIWHSSAIGPRRIFFIESIRSVEIIFPLVWACFDFIVVFSFTLYALSVHSVCVCLEIFLTLAFYYGYHAKFARYIQLMFV